MMIKHVISVSILLAIWSVFFVSGFAVVAQTTDSSLKFKPQVIIPNTDFNQYKDYSVGTYEGGYFTATLLPKYVAAIFKFGVWISITLAIFMMMLGGFIWTTAGGAQERVTSAKSYISHAITGLVLALLSYGILEGINPETLKLDAFKIKVVTPVSYESTLHYCQKSDGTKWTYAKPCVELGPDYTELIMKSYYCEITLKNPYDKLLFCVTNMEKNYDTKASYVGTYLPGVINKMELDSEGNGRYSGSSACYNSDKPQCDDFTAQASAQGQLLVFTYERFMVVREQYNR